MPCAACSLKMGSTQRSRHSNVTTTLGLYAHKVNASMMAAQAAMMQALETSSQTIQ
jgi:hypothetical protein